MVYRNRFVFTPSRTPPSSQIFSINGNTVENRALVTPCDVTRRYPKAAEVQSGWHTLPRSSEGSASGFKSDEGPIEVGCPGVEEKGQSQGCATCRRHNVSVAN